MCQNCIHKIEGRLSLKQHVHAEPCPKTSAPEELATAAVEVKFFGEELDLMESAACAANKSLSEFAPKLPWNMRKCICVTLKTHRQT